MTLSHVLVLVIRKKRDAASKKRYVGHIEKRAATGTEIILFWSFIVFFICLLTTQKCNVNDIVHQESF